MTNYAAIRGDASLPASSTLATGNVEPATIFVDPAVHPQIQPAAWCRNGMLVHASYQHQLAALANQVTRYRTKELFASCFSPVDNTVVRSVTLQNRWRFAGHTSPRCDTILARVIMGTTALTVGTSDPYGRLELFNAAGTSLGYGDYHFGVNTLNLTVSTAPYNLAVGTIAVDASAFPDTDIYGLFSDVQGSRLAAVSVYEISQFSYVTNGYLPQNYAIGAGIYDVDRQGVSETASALWKRGAAPVFTFSSELDSTAPSTASTSDINLIDSSATVSPNSAGYVIDVRYCSRKSSPTLVPCVLYAYASTNGTQACSVKLKDATGAVVSTATLPFTGAAQWKTVAFSLPAAGPAKYDLHFSGKLGDTITVMAAGVYQYQA